MVSRGNRKLQLIILLVLVSLVGTMSIAYAVLSTTLNINGTAQVQDASWNVHFDNVQVNAYSVPINPVITDNNKITFSADLTTPGDFYKFNVDIVNEGTIDAMIESIIKTPELTDKQKKYLRYEVEYVDGTSINDSQLLKSGETKTISILFSYRNDIPTSDLPSTESDYDLEIVLVYIQADETGTEIAGSEKIVKVVSGDLNTVGSEICIGTECFYLISSDKDSVTMFAKYNLKVGNVCTSSSSCTPIENPSGIQDSEMIGYPPDKGFPRYGTTAFSSTNYWYDGLELKAQYVYNSNSILYNYVENYKIYLEESQGTKIEEARLIKMEELTALGCASASCLNAPEWVCSTSYITGSVPRNSTGVFYVSSICSYNNATYSINNFWGVRPVITISKQEF